MQNWRMDDLLSNNTSNNLVEGLKFIQPRQTTGSLAAYDNFKFEELQQFMLIYRLELEKTINGSELFPGEMMKPEKLGVSLPNDMYNL